MLYQFPPTIDLKKQGIPVPGTETANTSAAYKSGLIPEELIYNTPEGTPLPVTVYEVFEQALAAAPNYPLFRKRLQNPPTEPGAAPTYSTQTVDTSYAETAARRNALGSALLALERLGRLRSPNLPREQSPPEVAASHLPAWADKLKAGARRGWGVGIWCPNREEWQIVDFACHAYGLVGVSLYETLGPDTAKYITNHAPLAIIFASANHLEELLRMAPDCPHLRCIVSVDALGSAERGIYTQWASSIGLSLYDMEELENWGNQPGIYEAPGPAEDEKDIDKQRIMTISYTSGTTGNPKGVILSNWNMTSAVVINIYGTPKTLKDGFRHYSYLPLAHIYERMLQFFVVQCRGTVCFSTGDVLKILEDAQIMKPHTMPGVPRIWNRVYAAIKLQMEAPGLKGALLRRAVATKLDNWRKYGTVTHPVYDRLVFSKIKALVGGECQYMITGSAPLAPDVHEILKIAFCNDFIQGYGMTETCASVSRTVPWDITSPGTCGFLLGINEAKLLDVPEMNYTHLDKPNPRGELLLKGTNIFTGYLHDPENTKKSFTEDGWFRTGDVAEIDECGRVKIIDRVKNVIKLSQGEYVPLEKVEGVYLLDPMFASVFVHGDSFRNSLVAVTVVDPVPGSAFVNNILGTRIQPTDIAALDEALSHADVNRAILDGLMKQARKHKLNGFEIVRGVHATAKPFEAHLLTPTQKVKRNVAADHYKHHIDRLYDEIEKAASKI